MHKKPESSHHPTAGRQQPILVQKQDRKRAKPRLQGRQRGRVGRKRLQRIHGVQRQQRIRDIVRPDAQHNGGNRGLPRGSACSIYF